jgi:prepilin-type N-terminal cleavage/methylation domain-containing protein
MEDKAVWLLTFLHGTDLANGPLRLPSGNRANESKMDNPRSGFSIIELVVVLMVGSILTGIALMTFEGVSGRYAVNGARQSFMSLHARARAQAVEYGGTVQLNLDPAGDSMWLSRNGQVLEVLDFDEDFKVDVRTSTSADLRVCMNARGFADEGCNNFTSPVTVTFLVSSDTVSVSVLTLGQMVAN